jgi:enolase
MVTSAGDEGGFAPYLSSNKAALEVTIPGLMFKSKKYSKEVIRQNGGCL